MITRLNIGGPAIQALLLTRELNDDFATVLAAGRAPQEEGEMTDPAIEVRRVPLQREINPVADLRSLRAIRKLIVELRPRIVHTHMAKAGAIGRLAARWNPSVRTVHTFHGHVLEGYFGRIKEEAFIKTERYLARRTDVLVAVAPQVRDALLEVGIGRPQQWRVIPLGFDLSPFLRVKRQKGDLRRRLGLETSVHLVGVLGRLAPVKDHALLLDAVARLPGTHLAILGDGELRAMLETRAMRAGLGGRVHFLGWVDDVAGAIADLDVVVISSLNEGTPVSLIEGLACACPVVATRVGGVPFVVDDEKTGLLVKDRSAHALAMQIRRLLDDRGFAARLGEEGQRRVRARFSKERLLTDIRDLYQELSS